MDTQVDPKLVIDDLLEQVKRLTFDNSMLRAHVAGLNDRIESLTATDPATGTET